MRALLAVTAAALIAVSVASAARYESSIAIASQAGGQVVFAVEQTKGKDASLWVANYCYDDPDAPPISEQYLPVVGEHDDGVQGLSEPFTIPAAAVSCGAYVLVWPNLYDRVSEVLVYSP